MPLASLLTLILGHADIIHHDARVFDLNHVYRQQGPADRGEYREVAGLLSGR